MNSKRLAFQTALKQDVPNVINISSQKCSEKNLLLKKLGLDSLPENIEVSLSSDNTCINIKLKDTPKTEKHLIFQIPLREDHLDFIENHFQKDILYDRYSKYINKYRNIIIENAKDERTFLQKTFPNMIFNQKIRMKSQPSYTNKLDSNIQKGKNIFIDDIVAERIIISKFNGSEEPEDLEKACYLVAEALQQFRKNSKFEVKTLSSIDSIYASDKPYISKDYIKSPKISSGYQSLHITIQEKNNPDFTYEIQIRTFDMEENSKNNEKQSHLLYKPRYLNDLSISKLPKYTEITHFIDKKDGKCIAFDLSVDECFYNYYHLLSKGIPINYKKYLKELTEIQKYINFENLRKKLRTLNTNIQKDREDWAQNLFYLFKILY